MSQQESNDTTGTPVNDTETQPDTQLDTQRKRPTLSGKVVDLAIEVSNLVSARQSPSNVAKKKRNRLKSKQARRSRAKNRRG